MPLCPTDITLNGYKNNMKDTFFFILVASACLCNNAKTISSMIQYIFRTVVSFASCKGKLSKCIKKTTNIGQNI